MERMVPTAFPSARLATTCVAWFVLIVSLGIQARPSAQQPAPPAKSAQPSSPIGAVSAASSQRQTLDRYCVTCHNQRLVTAGLKLDDADVANPVLRDEGADLGSQDRDEGLRGGDAVRVDAAADQPPAHGIRRQRNPAGDVGGGDNLAVDKPGPGLLVATRPEGFRRPSPLGRIVGVAQIKKRSKRHVDD